MLSVAELLVAAVALLVTTVVLVLYYLRPPQRLSNMIAKLPGPPAYPIIGNTLDMGTTTVDFYNSFERLCKEFYGSAFRIWLGNKVFVLLSVPQDIEVILSSNKLIEKSYVYDFTHPWLGTGLLTSTGAKWHKHRKILTPSFHFKILEQFIAVFLANGEILVDCLQNRVGGPAFDVHHFITLSALDNICETAMGLKVNAQKDTDSVYVSAVRNQSNVIMQRSFKPWLQPDFLFNLSSLKTKQTKALKILHDTTNGVIKARQEVMAREREANEGPAATVAEDGIKRRLAFLDLLIESTYNGSELANQDIREEVDTFMFEGHDTTAATITFALWLLAWHPDIQEAVVQELHEVWPDTTEPPTLNRLQELKYMERVIKETLRLYPSVPIFARHITEDTTLTNGHIVPKGATTTIVVYMTHRDPKIFPDPEKFDPDRFLPENVQGRHPYAYIPFSAGPRNCIGQKFAMLEIKCTLAQVLRNYKLCPGTDNPKLVLAIDVILKARDGVFLQIEPRQQ